jgi:hypothetical protein
VTPRRGLFWPLLLIAIGILFLLGNFGFIAGVSWIAILNLWPLLLVLVGIDLALARRWPLAALGAEVLVVAAAVALVTAAPIFGGDLVVFRGGDGGATDISVPRAGATNLSLRVNGGAGRYRLMGGATQLVEGHSANDDLRVRTSGGTRADVRVDQVGRDGIFRPTTSADIEIRIASDVPTSLDMNSGAGEFDIDLSDVQITDARVNTGASSTRLVVAKPKGQVQYRVNAGASSIVIAIPDGVEARVSTSGALLSLRSDNTRLGQGGGTGGCVACGSSIETSGYASASDRVTVTISAGASSIVVR